MKIPTLMGLMLLLMITACGDGADNTAAQAATADASTDAAPDTSEPIDTVTPEPEPTGRAVHRMTITQLASSIPVITGGIAWEEDFGEGPLDMLAILYDTLGGPDYILVTEENLDPSLIVAKFVQDATYRICAKWVERDKARTAQERTLIAHDDWSSRERDDVDASLRRLQLRFFARKIAPGDDDAIGPLRTLFETAADAAPAGLETDDGWLAVCLAMMTSPEMVLY
ncbi:MAG: hypothetical protein QF464_12300 [Myxococcota bacterium]|nr:hypothetical protein [Myxococcota bacterium]